MSASEQPQENTPVAMLWDFFGPNRAQTAEHHLIHLNEFATLKQLTPLALEVLQQQERSVVRFTLVLGPKTETNTQTTPGSNLDKIIAGIVTVIFNFLFTCIKLQP